MALVYSEELEETGVVDVLSRRKLCKEMTRDVSSPRVLWVGGKVALGLKVDQVLFCKSLKAFIRGCKWFLRESIDRVTRGHCQLIHVVC